jgi:glycosyltransferase involved in cell wall biosynthesis
MPPPGADPSLAVVTAGRLTAAKRPELLPLVAAALARRLPGATLTVVGGTHGTDRDGAWAAMMDRCGGVLPDNLHFAGPDDRTTAFLPRFACFYMVSSDQGSPNASLEAMASGLPVVANPDGGTAEQVEDGVNGRLVADCGDDSAFADSLARALADVLSDPARARAMGDAGRKRASQRFSMATMAASYVNALLGAEMEF